jgi:predicted TPR repeat methyltransferase
VRKAVELAPESAAALNDLGNVLEEQGVLDEAEAAFRQVIAAKPECAGAHSNLGVALKKLGKLEEAANELRHAVALDPGHGAAWHNLGNTLRKLHRTEEALSAYQEAIKARPYDAASYESLGRILYASGRAREAATVYETWLEREPLNPIPRHMFAATSGKSTPPRADDDFVRATFDRFAPTFDDVLGRLDYQAPRLVAENLNLVLGERRANTLSILDVGCGTGLCGPLLRSIAGELIGVDISPGMLARARERMIYDDLVEAEVVSFLRGFTRKFDAIISADTLCYFGDLAEVATALATSVRLGGHVVFTVELAAPEPPDGFRLEAHGRYVHGEGYVWKTLTAAGFHDVMTDKGTLRMEAGRPVRGLIVAARRSERRKRTRTNGDARCPSPIR